MTGPRIPRNLPETPPPGDGSFSRSGVTPELARMAAIQCPLVGEWQDRGLGLRYSADLAALKRREPAGFPRPGLQRECRWAATFSKKKGGKAQTQANQNGLPIRSGVVVENLWEALGGEIE